jgi:hypothetical protein
MKESRALNHAPIKTKNTALASALSAIGVPFQNPKWSKLKTDTGECVFWFFEKSTTDNKYATRQLIDWWYDDNWIVENLPKRHPWALLSSALSTREYLVDQIKQSIGHVIIKKNGKSWVVPEESDLHKKLKRK